MNKRILLFISVLLLSFTLTSGAHSQANDEAIQEAMNDILIAPELLEGGNQAVTAAWLGYALARVGWIRQNVPQEYIDQGYYARSFAEELYGRENMVKVWGELKDKDGTLTDQYLDEMLEVYNAGYIKEYVWVYLYEDGWEGSPTNQRLDEYIAWEEVNIPGHEPLTLAGLSTDAV